MGETIASAEIGWPLGPLEMRLLHTVWAHGRATVRAVVAHLVAEHPVAYTTVMTVMNRLVEKGLLRRELVGKSYFYTATLTPEMLAARISCQLLHSLQAELGEAAVAQFSAELGRIDTERLAALRRAATVETCLPVPGAHPQQNG